MSPIRRYYKKGNLYFVTNVTYKRKPILIEYIDLLWQAFGNIYKKGSFELFAWAILPEHMHIIIDPKNNNLSELMKRIKLSFSRKYRFKSGVEGRVWQYRFWDHIIRNQEDLNRHLDYIHYNAVKHSITSNPFSYEHSSLAKFFNKGYYEKDWGVRNPIIYEGDYGE